MNTKTSILTALVALASGTGAMAQVYSQNVVGYVNLNVPSGFAMIANQLASTNTTIGALIANPPAGTQIYKWNGSSYDTYEFFDGLGWFPDGNATLNLGEGAFIKNPTASPMTVTLVGEVSQGDLTNPLPAGFSIRSSIVPQSGTVDSLGFPAAAGDQIYKWVGASYDTYEYFDGLGWFPSVPSVSVGESFFVKKNVATPWVRNFQVN